MTDQELVSLLIDLAHAPGIDGSLVAMAADIIERYSAALVKIADDQHYRSGYDQTDITVEPALSATEAQTLARLVLSGLHP